MVSSVHQKLQIDLWIVLLQIQAWNCKNQQDDLYVYLNNVVTEYFCKVRKDFLLLIQGNKDTIVDKIMLKHQDGILFGCRAFLASDQKNWTKERFFLRNVLNCKIIWMIMLLNVIHSQNNIISFKTIIFHFNWQLYQLT